ncbi:MarR family winged helix-turn-helix transcriptional regulator [Halarcobacter ebronensis]|uniref:MarR family transcriptional regulator n=1 Tax=Halarcobacter ebronensis TaxID=1462615 RepID=A0A4Q1APJ1_9BACT|nr:MarR family transcriptional regulator [Halarcobacter ebronensis]QKF80736.1 transcriptional regulator, MarR family [Halarcobacter ebronensis]RXK08529.1 MarR family transcriptional regulator [Halarcobacter ebronensis]
MNHRKIVSLSSKLSDKANKFIISELKQNGLSDIAPSHGDILAILFDGKAYEMGEIAKKIYKTNATVSVLVEKLVKAGYIDKIKCDEDARISRVSLTSKGFDLKEIVDLISVKLNNKVCKGLSESEAMLLEILLEKSIESFDK